MAFVNRWDLSKYILEKIHMNGIKGTAGAQTTDRALSKLMKLFTFFLSFFFLFLSSFFFF